MKWAITDFHRDIVKFSKNAFTAEDVYYNVTGSRNRQNI